jgi:hypothetical protein
MASLAHQTGMTRELLHCLINKAKIGAVNWCKQIKIKLVRIAVGILNRNVGRKREKFCRDKR